MTRAVRVLATDVAVAIDDDLPLAEVAHGLLDAYAPAEGEPQLSYRLRGGARPALERSGAPDIGVDDARDVVPRFELELYRQVTARAPAGWLLHAAALWIDGGAVVIAGPSGAGKTTLALALLGRGAGYLTEEVALVDSSGGVTGLARPVHLMADDPRRAMVPAEWRQLAYPIRGVDGPRAHVIAVPPPRAIRHGAAPLRAIVRVQYRPGAPGGAVAPGASAMMMSLWAATLRPDRAALDTAATILQRWTAHELTTRGVEQAVAAVDEVLGARALRAEHVQ